MLNRSVTGVGQTPLERPHHTTSDRSPAPVVWRGVLTWQVAGCLSGNQEGSMALLLSVVHLFLVNKQRQDAISGGNVVYQNRRSHAVLWLIETSL